MTLPTAGTVDAHVHMYPAQVAADPAGWGRDHGEPAWTDCVAPRGRRSIQGWSDPRTLMADMDEAGIGACVMLGWYWQRQETCDLQNGWYLDWIRRHPGKLLGFAAVQPAGGQRSVDALSRALDGGLCGIGELLPPPALDAWWIRVIEIAAARGVPLVFHATDPQAGAAAGPPTPLGEFVRMAGDFPKATFILAHWGGGLAFRQALAGEGPLPANLYFDTAASPLLYGPGVFREAIAKIGAERILYGSDYPLILHPRESRKADFRRFLQEILDAGLSEAERTAILGSNIRRLLGRGAA
jgi:predicted TIM-barrel fold metal-dependent hydrolase